MVQPRRRYHPFFTDEQFDTQKWRRLAAEPWLESGSVEQRGRLCLPSCTLLLPTAFREAWNCCCRLFISSSAPWEEAQSTAGFPIRALNSFDLEPQAFILFISPYSIYLPRCLSGKESICQCRIHKRYGFDPWVGKIPSRRKRQPTPVCLPGETHGQRSLVGYSPWGRKRVKTPLSTARQQEITLVGPDKPIQEKELLFPHFQPNLYILTNKESRCEDISLSRAAERLVAGTVYSLSRVWLLYNPMDCRPLSMGFPRQEYWSGLPLPSPAQGVSLHLLCLLHCRQILYCWATEKAHRAHESILKFVGFFYIHQ